MFKKFLIVIYCLLSLCYLAYLAFPNPDFPEPIPGALQSKEPGDTETPLRRAYFTNLTREEAMNHYLTEFRKSTFFGLSMPSYRLNYPPEESATIIRDQTRSTYLEEVTHPFRESIYINGFEPKDEKDEINIEGGRYRQKIIVKYVPSSAITRILVGILEISLLWVLIIKLLEIIKSIKGLKFKL